MNKLEIFYLSSGIVLFSVSVFLTINIFSLNNGYKLQSEIPNNFTVNGWKVTLLTNNVKFTDGAHNIDYHNGLIYMLSYRSDTLIINDTIKENVCKGSLGITNTIKNTLRNLKGDYVSKAHYIKVTDDNYYIACDEMHSIVDKNGIVYSNDSFRIYALDEKDGYITFATKSDNGVGLIKDGKLLWYNYSKNCFNAKFNGNNVITSNESALHVSKLGIIEARYSGIYLNNKQITTDTAREITTGDVDKDGDIDIITANADISAIILYNNTNNNFKRQIIDSGSHLFWVHDVKFIDGRLYVASSGSNAFMVYDYE